MSAPDPRICTVILALALCPGLLHAQASPGPYLGQDNPGLTAQAFAPWIFEGDRGGGCSGFLREGTVFVFKYYKPGGDWRFSPVYWTELRGDVWSEPAPVPWTEYLPYNFTVGPSGQTVYFTSLKSPDLTTAQLGENGNIWAVTLLDTGWTTPVMLGTSINTPDYYENYPTVASDGTIYYMSRREVGEGRTDVWMSPNLDGRYGPAVNLGPPVNSAQSDQDPFVSPDGSYLLICLTGREDSLGGYDLYVSFRQEGGRWGEPRNLGPGVNTSGAEFRPSVTQDGKYLFFTSNGWSDDGTGEILWVDARVITEVGEGAGG